MTKFHCALLTPLGDSMFSRLASPHEPPRGLYEGGYLEEKFSSKVGPGGYPPAGWNQPLMWTTPSMVPPSDHPWASEEWDDLGSSLGDDFERVRRQDTFRLCLYAAGRVALETYKEVLCQILTLANAL